MYNLPPSGESHETESVIDSEKIYSNLFLAAVKSLESTTTRDYYLTRFRYLKEDSHGSPAIEVVNRKLQPNTHRYAAYIANKITPYGQEDITFGDEKTLDSREFYTNQPFRLGSVLKAMLTEENASELARASISMNLEDRGPNTARGVRRNIFKSFFESGEGIFEPFLQSVHEALSSDDEDELMSADKFTNTMNVEARGWIATDKSELAHMLLYALDAYALVRPDELNDVQSMTDPAVASILAQRAEREDVFCTVKPAARRNMANLLLQSVVERFTTSPGRHHHNAELIKKLLFNKESYDRTLRMMDLLKLANSLTDRLNQTSSGDKARDLLPVGGEGSVMFINCGEAIFRILSVTATTPDHITENRSYAELFDALMKPYYQDFEKSRPVTIADICARYPDVKDDIVLELQSIARNEGYSAASNYYRKVSGKYGSHSRWRKHKPGYGVIS